MTASTPNMKNKASLLSILLSLILLAGILYFADFKLLTESLKNINTQWLIYAAIAMAGLLLVSAWRLCFLIMKPAAHNKQMYLSSLEINCWHHILQRFLPFRLGEVFFFLLAKKKLALDLSSSLGPYTLIRLWDFRIVFVSFILSGGFVLLKESEMSVLYIGIAIIPSILLLVISAVDLLNFVKKMLGYVNQVFSFSILVGLGNTIEEAINKLKEKDMKMSVLVWLPALLSWSLSFAVFHSVINGLGMPISYTDAVMVTSGLALVSIIPIQAIAGLGVNEAAQAGFLSLLGLAMPQAISISLGLSLLHMLLSLIVPFALIIGASGVKMIIGKPNSALLSDQDRE